MTSPARAKARRGPAPPPPPAGPAWPPLLLAVAGVLVSGYLGALKLRGGTAVLCEAGGGCDIVQASRYATMLGVPTALWGTAFYLAIAVLAALGLDARRWRWAFLLAAAGVAFSAYLTVISVAVLGAACVWCLVSAAIALALFAWLLAARPPGRTTRMPRVLALGGGAAVATVVVAAAIFAAYPGGASSYQFALARHLAKVNGVMYGTYW